MMNISKNARQMFAQESINSTAQSLDFVFVNLDM